MMFSDESLGWQWLLLIPSGFVFCLVMDYLQKRLRR
jgi:hypothetical protein